MIATVKKISAFLGGRLAAQQRGSRSNVRPPTPFAPTGGEKE
jgi:hypothetical protein